MWCCSPASGSCWTSNEPSEEHQPTAMSCPRSNANTSTIPGAAIASRWTPAVDSDEGLRISAQLRCDARVDRMLAGGDKQVRARVVEIDRCVSLDHPGRTAAFTHRRQACWPSEAIAAT
jgi:hypothetical protein